MNWEPQCLCFAYLDAPWPCLDNRHIVAMLWPPHTMWLLLLMKGGGKHPHHLMQGQKKKNTNCLTQYLAVSKTLQCVSFLGTKEVLSDKGEKTLKGAKLYWQ